MQKAIIALLAVNNPHSSFTVTSALTIANARKRGSSSFCAVSRGAVFTEAIYMRITLLLARAYIRADIHYSQKPEPARQTSLGGLSLGVSAPVSAGAFF